MPRESKQCKDCGSFKPLAEFNKTPNKEPGKSGFGTGLRSRCRECNRKHYRAWRLKNKENAFNPAPEKYCSFCQTVKPSAAFSRNRSAVDGLDYICRVCKRVKYVKEGRRTAEEAREHNLRQKRGMELTDYEAMMQRQNGQCPICNRPIQSAGRGYAPVDHDHHTGRVRGILYLRCNLWLGVLEHMESGALERVRIYLSC